MNKTKIFMFVLLLVAIVSVGAVSAETLDVSDETQASTVSTDDAISAPAETPTVSTDDSMLNNDVVSSNSEDISTDDVSSTLNTYTVNNSTSLENIQNNITAASLENGTVNFQEGNYYNFTILGKDNVKLSGDNAILIGNGVNYIIDLTDTTGCSITGFTLLINSNTSNAISGSNVNNCLIENNTIMNGGDAINIFKYYTNVTVNNNTIQNMSGKFGDAISLVNHNTTIDMDNWIGATITNNIIDSVTYGIFLGGNAKGTISGNVINDATEGMHFQGKKAETNGQLNLTVSYNNLTNVITGIEMDHPNVLAFNMFHNNITCADINNDFSINTNNYFGAEDNIEVTYNNLDGKVSSTFVDATTTANNNTGTGAY